MSDRAASEPTSARLRIRLFGPFEVEVDGEPVGPERWERPKAIALVKRLAVARGHRLHREQLMDAIWPHLDPERASRQLSKALSQARRALEPRLAPRAVSRFLIADRYEIALGADGDVWVDVEGFERLAARAVETGDVAEGEAALRLDRGELLAGEQYEEWAAVRREHVSGLRRELQLALARIYAAREETGRAVALLDSLLLDDPTNEVAHRELMSLYATTGRRDLAIRQFHACADALARDLDVGVDAATDRLYARIVAGELAAARAATELPALPAPVRPPAARLARPNWAAAALALALALAGIAPVAASSREIRRRIDHTWAKVGADVARIRGYEPGLMTVIGRVDLAGARVEAVDSVSGWAALADDSGRFRLPDLTWYPNAAHELVVSDDRGSVMRVAIVAPLRLPEGGVVDVGQIAFVPGPSDADDPPHTNAASYVDPDDENAAYYRRTFDTLAGGLRDDLARVEAVCRYVRSRYDPTRPATAVPLGARRTLERGSSQCGDLSFAMAEIVRVAGYRVRAINVVEAAPSDPHAHMVVEVFYGGAWHVFDPTFGFDDAHPSYVELRRDPSRLAAPAWLRAAYGSGAHHYYRFRERASG